LLRQRSSRLLKVKIRKRLAKRSRHQSLLLQHQLSNPFEKVEFDLLDEDDDWIVNSKIRRLVVYDSPDEDEIEVTDYIKLRLFLAREKALRRFKEVHS
jgi:hypothetical protein